MSDTQLAHGIRLGEEWGMSGTEIAHGSSMKRRWGICLGGCYAESATECGISGTEAAYGDTDAAIRLGGLVGMSGTEIALWYPFRGGVSGTEIAYGVTVGVTYGRGIRTGSFLSRCQTNGEKKLRGTVCTDRAGKCN
eukprot:140179-Rhodomonas_salina.2